MQISRLHLCAYGHFTDESLDFGPRPGLHIVYGDNETGKSTALRALTSVLFGYPHEVIDGFKHDAKDIAIGADLIGRDGRRLSFVRRRRGKNALADASGVPLDESAVATFVAGVSKEVFDKVFALDHERLRKHAHALLAEGGALGFSLAEAGSGIAGLKAALDRLNSERADLFLASGSKRKLNRLIGQLTEFRREARRRTVSPDAYKKLQNRIEEVEALLNEARDRQKMLAGEITRLQRIQRNLARRAEHAALTKELTCLAAVPVLQSEAGQQRVKAHTARDTAKTAFAAATAAIENLARQIAAIAPDAAILARAEDIASIAELRPVIAKTEDDLPRREAERSEHLTTVINLLDEAELTGDPEALEHILPSALRRKAIGTLAEQGTKLIAQRVTTAEQVAQAKRDLKAAEEQQTQAAKPQETGNLDRALVVADKLGDITTDIDRRTRALDRKAAMIQKNILSLGIQSGDASTLRALVVPPGKTVERFARELTGLDEAIAKHQAEIAHLDNEIRDREDRILALRTAGVAVSDDDLAAARRAREDGWTLVRGLYIEERPGLDAQATTFAPNGRVADEYERRVAGADGVADDIRAHTKEATELSLHGRQKTDLEAKEEDTLRQMHALTDQRAALLDEWRRLWPEGSITPQLPGEMTEWLARRVQLLAEADELGEERDEIGVLANKRSEAATALVEALQAFGAPAPVEQGLDALRQHARLVLEEIAKANTQYEKVKEAVGAQERHKSQAEETLATLDAHIADWTAKWEQALDAAGVSRALTIATATTVLAIMNEIDIEKKQIDVLRHRIAGMENDREGFRAAVNALAHLLTGVQADDPITACRQLEDRLKTTQAAAAEVKALDNQMKIRTEERDREKESIERSETALKSLCALAGCVDPEELPEIEARSSEKQQALGERASLEKRIREDGVGLSIEALFAECDGTIGDQIPAELSSRAAEVEEVAKKIEEVLLNRADLKAEFDRLLAQDQAADFTQQAANVEAEIGETVETYVDLTLQETLLRQAVEVYRDRNQGPILGRAKGLFAQLTDGEYAGLRADVDEKNEPILIAEHRTKGSLEISALSDSTVDALYLALRLAAIQEHNAMQEPLPFIADDLLLNLDNTRTAAAFRTLANIFASSQVLFFTHHAHMLEIARLAVPKDILFEHHLPSINQSAATPSAEPDTPLA